MYEDEEMPLRGKHLEDWYCYNVWSDIIDKLFRSLRHVTLERYVPNRRVHYRRFNGRSSGRSGVPGGTHLLKPTPERKTTFLEVPPDEYSWGVFRWVGSTWDHPRNTPRNAYCEPA
jgi:hypothetical protein